MTTPSTLLRLLAPVLLTALPALAQTVTGTVTAATQLRVSAGNPPANTNTRPAGTNLTGGLNLGTSWTFTPLFVSVNSAFGYSATATSITHTIQESMSGFNAAVSAGPHATLLTLTASQPVVGTLIVQYTPGANSGGSSSTASIDVGNDGSAEWTYAPGSLTYQHQVTVNGSLQIRVATAMVSTSHSLSVQFTSWTAVAQLPMANNGFENGINGWTASGTVFALGTSSGIAPRTGAGQCLLAGYATVEQRFAASSGETYALHCYAARDAHYFPGDTASARFEFLNALGFTIHGAAATLLSINTPSATWISSPTLQATAPPGTTAVRVTLQYYQFVPTGESYFDDISFERVDGCGGFTLPIGAVSGFAGKYGAYYTLDTHAPGVRICGIDMPVTAAAGAAVQATVYQHRSLTSATQLTQAQATADNWCPIATLQGVAMGTGQLTPFAITNATNSLDLATGQSLLAIMVNSNAPGVFRFTPATGFTAIDAGSNLELIAGESLNDRFLPPDPLAPPVAGYVPATLHYEVLSAPPIPTGCAAEALAVGTACGGEPNTVFEMLSNAAWDLTGSDVVATGNGSGASLRTSAATPLDPVVGPPIPLTNGLSGSFPLGFSLDAFGLAGVSSISMSDSGQVFFGGQSTRRGYPTPGVWSNDPVARLAACCTQFVAGDIHVDTVAGVRTTVTFVNMWEANYNQYSTFQVAITPTTMRVRYDPASWFQGFVGFHNGIALPVPPHLGQVDLTAGPSAFTSPNAGPDVTLTVLTRPLLGANFDFRIDNSSPLSLVFLDFVHAAAGLQLPEPLFAPGCNLYVNPNSPLVFTVANGSVASSLTPNNTAFLGVAFAIQGGGLLPNGRLAASRAYNGIVGNW